MLMGTCRVAPSLVADVARAHQTEELDACSFDRPLAV